MCVTELSENQTASGHTAFKIGTCSCLMSFTLIHTQTLLPLNHSPSATNPHPPCTCVPCASHWGSAVPLLARWDAGSSRTACAYKRVLRTIVQPAHRLCFTHILMHVSGMIVQPAHNTRIHTPLTSPWPLLGSVLLAGTCKEADLSLRFHFELQLPVQFSNRMCV